MCAHKCFRVLHDSFTSEHTSCEQGFYFGVNSRWRCDALDGKCTRMCLQHFRHFQRVLHPSTFLFLEDYMRSKKDNEISLHYGPCGRENVTPMKVLGVTLQTEVVSQNGYAVFGDKRTGAKGAAVVNETKSMHLGQAGFTVEGWVRIPSTPMIKQDPAVGASYVPDETWIDTEETIQCSANVVNDIMGNLKDMAMSKVDSAVGGLVDGLKNAGVPAEVTLNLGF